MNLTSAAKTASDMAWLAFAACAGGACFGLAGIPAGWLSGSMVGVAILAAIGKGSELPGPLRQLAILTSGAGMGSGLTPATLHALARYPGSLLLMTLGLIAMVATSFAILQRSRGFSRETAFFSAIPGALSYVFIVAASTKADLSRVAVIQIFRLFVLMAIVPLVARASVSGVQRLFPTDPLVVTAALLLLSGVVAWFFERRGVLSATLYAGIVISAAAHGAGLAPGRLAPSLQIVAQVLVGAWIGARFIGFDWELLHRCLLAAATSFLSAFAIAALLAVADAWFFSVSFPEALAAFAPGGLEAMTMMAFALGLDPLFVGAHHIARFFLLSLGLPFAARTAGIGRADDRSLV